MRVEFIPFFERRLELTPVEADALAQIIAEDPTTRQWLRDQLAMDDLLSRLLHSERHDFVNRVRVAGDLRSDDHFTNRVTKAALLQRQPTLRRNVRPASANKKIIWPLVTAAAALLIMSLAFWAWMTENRSGMVIDGHIAVDQQAVQQVPSGAGFTVSDAGPATIQLTAASHAQLDSQSTGTLHEASDHRTPTFELASGGGEFNIDKQDSPLRIETGSATITSADGGAQFSTQVHPIFAKAKQNLATDPHHKVHPPMELTVTVKKGSAQVDVQGKRQTIQPNEGRVFKIEGGRMVSNQRAVSGTLKAIKIQDANHSVTIKDHSGSHEYDLTPQTQIRINALVATLGDLHLNDHIEARFESDAPTVLSELVIRRNLPRAANADAHDHPNRPDDKNSKSTSVPPPSNPERKP